MADERAKNLTDEAVIVEVVARTIKATKRSPLIARVIGGTLMTLVLGGSIALGPEVRQAMMGAPQVELTAPTIEAVVHDAILPEIQQAVAPLQEAVAGQRGDLLAHENQYMHPGSAQSMSALEAEVSQQGTAVANLESGYSDMDESMDELTGALRELTGEFRMYMKMELGPERSRRESP